MFFALFLFFKDIINVSSIDQHWILIRNEIKNIYIQKTETLLRQGHFFRKSKKPKRPKQAKKASQDSVDHLHLKEKQSVTVCSFDNNDALPAKNSQAQPRIKDPKVWFWL